MVYFRINSYIQRCWNSLNKILSKLRPRWEIKSGIVHLNFPVLSRFANMSLSQGQGRGRRQGVCLGGGGGKMSRYCCASPTSTSKIFQKNNNNGVGVSSCPPPALPWRRACSRSSLHYQREIVIDAVWRLNDTIILLIIPLPVHCHCGTFLFHSEPHQSKKSFIKLHPCYTFI